MLIFEDHVWPSVPWSSMSAYSESVDAAVYRPMCGVGAGRADEGSFVPTTNPVVVDLHLPPPWGAPERDWPGDRCNRTTRHYGRRLTSSVDDDSDRAAGTVVWFCADCGHRHERGAGNASLQQNDDALAELFDRH